MAEAMQLTQQMNAVHKTTVNDVGKLSKCYQKLLIEKDGKMLLGDKDIRYLKVVKEVGEKVVDRKLDIDEVKTLAMAIDRKVAFASRVNADSDIRSVVFLFGVAVGAAGAIFSEGLLFILGIAMISTGVSNSVSNREKSELAATSIDLNIKKIAGEKQ